MFVPSGSREVQEVHHSTGHKANTLRLGEELTLSQRDRHHHVVISLGVVELPSDSSGVYMCGALDTQNYRMSWKYLVELYLVLAGHAVSTVSYVNWMESCFSQKKKQPTSYKHFVF